MDLMLIHYYLQKGIEPDKITGASQLTRCFYQASMELELERYQEIADSMRG